MVLWEDAVRMRPRGSEFDCKPEADTVISHRTNKRARVSSVHSMVLLGKMGLVRSRAINLISVWFDLHILPTRSSHTNLIV